MSDNNELALDFILETDRIAEIAIDSDEWGGDEVTSVDDEELAEMVKGDEKPFFVEFTALDEGV